MIEAISISVMGAQLMYFMKKLVDMSKVTVELDHRVNKLEEKHD